MPLGLSGLLLIRHQVAACGDEESTGFQHGGGVQEKIAMANIVRLPGKTAQGTGQVEQIAQVQKGIGHATTMAGGAGRSERRAWNRF
jgi:hypothetical protein